VPWAGRHLDACRLRAAHLQLAPDCGELIFTPPADLAPLCTFPYA